MIKELLGCVSGLGRRWLMLVAAGLALALVAGCEDHSGSAESTWETRLYAVEAGAGVFAPTAEARVYTLTTRQLSDQVVWFSDLPLREAGTNTLREFVEDIWPVYFTNYRPAVGVGTRSSDGVWSILPAEVLDAAYDAGRGTLTWTLRLDGTPDTGEQTGVVMYLDDAGALGAALGSYVFTHAAARASFEPVVDGGHRLTFRHPLPELVVMAVAPSYDAAVVPVDYFVDTMWKVGFSYVPPNAAVTMEAPDGRVVTTAVTLSEPVWDAATDTLSFRAEALNGTLPDFAGPAVLYVDSFEEGEDTRRYKVVVNHEEQYSIWLADRENALGWRDEGFSGTKVACLDHIKEVWTDMRPLSLRKKMEEMAKEWGR